MRPTFFTVYIKLICTAYLTCTNAQNYISGGNNSGLTVINFSGVPDPCKLNPCGLNAVCSVSGRTISCTCPRGSEGDALERCIIKNPCEPNPCGLNAECSANGKIISCTYPISYEGHSLARCIIRNPCEPNPCGINADCRAHGKVPVCNCPNGYQGDPHFNCTTVNECPGICPAIYDPVCGSDGITYSSACSLAVASCQNPKDNITTVYDGECDLFNECPGICPAIYDPVCGSDGITYSSACSLAVASCQNPKDNITTVYDGECDPYKCTDGPSWKQDCNDCICVNELTTCTKRACHPFYSGVDLWKAVRDGNLAKVNTILAADVNPNWQNKEYSGYTSLHNASANNQPAIMKVLLDAGASKDIRDKSGFTSIFHASDHSHIDALSTLIDYGANVDLGTNDNYTRETPSDKARRHGYHQLEKIMQGFPGNTEVQNAGPEISDRTVNQINNELDLWNSARDGNLASVKTAIKKGINPNWKNQNEYGYTSLHIAALNNHPMIMTVLLDAGAKKDVQDNSGYTPILAASNRGSKDAVLTLTKYGADVDLATHLGYTPLMQATVRGYTAIVEALIGANANIKMTNKGGETAFFAAASYNRLNIAQLLLRKGADPRKTDNAGRTPADHARDQGYSDLANYIDRFIGVIGK